MLRPRDLAKIGYLYLRGGRWRDQQLLPPSWIDAVNHAAVDMHASFDPAFRYANLFWALADRHAFMAVGDHCQLVMVMPDVDVVAVITSRNYCPFRKLAEDIASAVRSGGTLPANADAMARLAHAVDAAAGETPIAAAALPETAATISGRRYTFPDNALGISGLRLHFAADPGYELDITLPNADGRLFRISGPLGLDGVFRKGTPTVFGIPAAKGTWRDDATFSFDFQYVGLDEQRSTTLSVSGDGLILRGKARDQHIVTVASESWADWFRRPLHALALLLERAAASMH
jgi:hypothetical protein